MSANATPDQDEQLTETLERKRATDPPKLVHRDDEAGVDVRGPYHRLDRRRGSITRCYTVTYTDPPGSPRAQDRRKEQRRTKAAAEGRARELAANVRAGASAQAGARRHEPVSALLEAHLDPAKHPKGRRGGRPTGWSSARTLEGYRTTARWVRSLVGDLPCSELGRPLSGRGDALDGLLPFAAVLYSMEVAGLAASTRRTNYNHLRGIVTFGREHGFLPPHVDPLGLVVEPLVEPYEHDLPVRFVPPAEIPTRAAIDALAEIYGGWHQRRPRWSPTYAWRWAQMPLVVAHSGLRLSEMLAVRACDVLLDGPYPRIRVHWQADRDGQRKPPKHGSRRAAACPVWLQPVLEQLVAVAEAAGGPDALLWPALLDPSKPVRHDAFTTSYFHPQAAAAHELLADRGLGGWAYEDVPQWEAPGVPRLNASGEQVIRREFTHTIGSLRHHYASVALAPVEQGGWGASIADVSKWMGHRSKKITHDMYQGCLPEAVSHHAEATRTDPHQPVTLDAAPHR